MNRTGRSRRTLLPLLAVLAMVMSLSTAITATSAAAAPGKARYVPAPCNTLTAEQRSADIPVAQCFNYGLADADGHVITHAAAAGPPTTALSPTDLRDAYRLPDAGEGMTVAIVDAFGYANAEADLAVYRSYYGLPPCTTENGCFTKVDQRGGTDYPPEDGGWSIETALDLDAVSAVCPRCDILLVQGDTNDVTDLGESVATAASLGAMAISNSYGVYGEIGTDALDAYYDHPGIAVTVSSGDDGDIQSWPATVPEVASIGGTTLAKDDSERGWHESVWNGAGSGCSAYEPRPDYQLDIDTGCPDTKATADFSADADPASGLAVYNTLATGGWSQRGGTSLAAPLVAAMYALAGAPTPTTYPVTYPYRKADQLNDITEGVNGNCGNQVCTAGPGWDGPSGLGTPNGVGALTLGESGEVSGTVTDAGSKAVIAGATVTAKNAAGETYSARTAADGHYELYAPVGTYDVSTSMYGYEGKSVTGVELTAGGQTRTDFALTALPVRTISGTVTDGSGHGWPMRAKITVDGYPGGPVYSDPVTGRYSVSLPAGTTYQLHVTPADLDGYVDQDLSVALGEADVREDVALRVDATTCTALGYAFHDEGMREAFTDWTGATPQDGWTITDEIGNGQTWRFDNPGGWAPPPGADGYFATINSAAYPEDGVQDSSLVSPAIDLSDVDNPEVGFDTTYIGFPDQTGSVDVSVDGGDTWSSVWAGRVSGNPNRVDVPIPQAGRTSDVRLRFHFTGSYSRRWEVDNVLVGTRTCAPTTGGLVTGFVTDENTGEPVNGATVASGADEAELGVSAATPDDTGVDDGYYWLFSSHTGDVRFDTTAGRYATSATTVDVAADAVTRHDITLAAGQLTVSTNEVSVSEVLGDTKSKVITFGNAGTAPVHVRLGESDGGSTPLATGTGAPLVQVPAEQTMSARPAEKPAAPPKLQPRQANPSAAPWTDLADLPIPIMDNAVAYHDGKVYVVGGTDGFAPSRSAFVYDTASGEWSAIARTPEPIQAAAMAFIGNTLYLAGGWDAAGAGSRHAYAYDPGTDTWSRIADLPFGVSAPGSGVVANRLYVVGGCTTSSCTPMSSAVASYDPGSDTWRAEADLPVAAAWPACGGVTGALVCAGGLTDAGPVAGTYALTLGAGAWAPRADLPAPTWASAVSAANGRLQLIGGQVDGQVTNAGKEFDPNTNSWSPLPNANNATFRGGAACGVYHVGGSLGGFNPTPFAERLPGYDDCGGDVPWLSVSTTEFDVAPGKTVDVRVSADSSAVSQPGTETGLLVITADTPYPSLDPVTVSMTVTPPRTWGKITGTVTSGGAPVAGATVAVCTMYSPGTGMCGPTTFTLKTDQSGHYQLWLNKGYNPLQVIYAKDGYTPLMKVVRIHAGETTTVDVSLAANSTFDQKSVGQYMNDTLHPAETR